LAIKLKQEGMACIEILKAELAAIDKQDRAYWQTAIPTRDEKFEYLVRQDRRRAIVDELMNVLQRTEMLRSKSAEDVTKGKT
jgi:hypothetical protein